MTEEADDRTAAGAGSEDLTDENTPLGDTPEAHDEINPHDLPPDHPGRAEAERQAAGEEGTTRGSEELLEVGPDREEPEERRRS